MKLRPYLAAGIMTLLMSCSYQDDSRAVLSSSEDSSALEVASTELNSGVNPLNITDKHIKNEEMAKAQAQEVQSILKGDIENFLNTYLGELKQEDQTTKSLIVFYNDINTEKGQEALSTILSKIANANTSKLNELENLAFQLESYKVLVIKDSFENKKEFGETADFNADSELRKYTIAKASALTLTQIQENLEKMADIPESFFNCIKIGNCSLQWNETLTAENVERKLEELR